MFSCAYNYKNVEVNGVVVNSETGKPINEDEILVTYWVYSTETWDSKSLKKITTSNEQGQFNFKQVEAIDIEVNANDYQQWMKSITVNKRKIVLEIEMSPILP